MAPVQGNLSCALRDRGGPGSFRRPNRSEIAEDIMAETTKFAAFITSHKLDPRRILAASHQLEKLRPEDRQIKLNKRRGKVEGAENAPKETRKPRTGRPVTPRAMDSAMNGGDVSGPTKSQILRAVNHLLEQKKTQKVELKALF